MKQQFYYSIVNGGDGSAGIKWFESAELASWHQEQENRYDGWAEDCSGSITLESDAPITFLNNINNKYSILLNLIRHCSLGELETLNHLYSEEAEEYEDYDYKVKDLIPFIKQFFSECFKLKFENKNKTHFDVLVDGKIVDDYFVYPQEEITEEVRLRLENELNEKVEALFKVLQKQ